jgi:signal transduction histidine kinase
MQEGGVDRPEQEYLFSSNLSPGPTQNRLAVYSVFGFFVVFFLVLGPLSSVQFDSIPSFLPIYATATLVSDLITAMLLFAQFSILRSRSLLVIASGYLFTALIVIPWILTIPTGIAPKAPLGGLQTAGWLYTFWHNGFILFVIGYALSRERNPGERFRPGSARAPIIVSVTLTAAVVLAVSFLCIAGEPLLPHLAVDPLRFTTLWPYIIGGPGVLLSLVAVIMLWLRRRSMLDLWLIVALCAYAIELPLTYYPSPVRFSLGWYTVRIGGFVSSVIVLVVLLYEIMTIYERLLRAVLAQRREREARLMTGDQVAATIAHEVKQPLSAMMTRADTGILYLDRQVPDIDRAREQFRKINADGHRAAAVIQSVRANYKKIERPKSSLDVNDLIGEAIGLLQSDLKKHRIKVQAELNIMLPRVMGDPIQLLQLLLNLITNAIDSMAAKEGPRILGVRSEAQDDGGVMVSVSDTGIGISAQDIERVFNPLFTTKPGGMGMGLAICRSIVEAHESRLSVVSGERSGAEFQFVLRPAK